MGLLDERSSRKKDSEKKKVAEPKINEIKKETQEDLNREIHGGNWKNVSEKDIDDFERFMNEREPEDPGMIERNGVSDKENEEVFKDLYGNSYKRNTN